MNYELLEKRSLHDGRMTGLRYRHTCGLELISLETDDTENMFSIGFKTTPVDNTGVTHIIEHSVLGGSKKYPVKDPFMEMIKGSLATFINAVTYHDHTLYPIASTVSRDFFNLASVYFDAVFNPLITPNTLAQEGWHYDFAKPGNIRSRLVTNGIVLNEMKGDTNNIDVIICREINKTLFSQTSRRFISGGDPRHIPELSYRHFIEYYRSHYHPSLARVFFYGDIPTQEKLDFLDKALQELAPISPAPALPPQPPCPVRWTKPRTKTARFSPNPSEGLTKGAWAKSYMLTTTWDPQLGMFFDFIDYLLLGNLSSPLKKAILESKLCEDFAISGYDDETCDTSFLVAVQGIAPKDFGKMDRLVQGVFQKYATQGFSQEQIETVFTRHKLNQRRIGKNYVYQLMEEVFDAWFNDQNPFLYIELPQLLQEIQKELQEKPTLLQDLIRTYFCDNTHVLTLKLLPDKHFVQKIKQKEAAKLAAINKTFTPHKRKAIAQKALELKQLQETPNSPEALATLPKLPLDVFPKRPKLLTPSVTHLSNGIDFIETDLFANHITQLILAFPYSNFSPDELQFCLFATALIGQVGTQNHSYDEFAAQVARQGAIFSISPASFYRYQAPDAPIGYITLSLTTLDETFEPALELFTERKEKTLFTEKQRIQTLLTQMQSRYQDILINDSDSLALTRATCGLSLKTTYDELSEGISLIPFLKKIFRDFTDNPQWLQEKLHRITTKLFHATPIAASYLGSEANREKTISYLKNFTISPLPLTPLSPPSLHFPATDRHEFLAIPSDVSTCTRSFQAPHLWDPQSPSTGILCNLLSQGYLWDEIRVKGGAYGARASYNPNAGIFSFTSSQDPSPLHTLEIFSQLKNHPLQLSQTEVNNAIISTAKTILNPNRPSHAPFSALAKFITHTTNDAYYRLFDALLSVTAREVVACFQAFCENNSIFNDCVIGPQQNMNGKHTLTSIKL